MNRSIRWLITVGATVTGTFTLTYTGPRPAAITFYTLAGLPRSDHPSTRILITAQGNPTPISASPELPVTQVGPHRYLYQIVHWHHAQWPMTVQQTNREFSDHSIAGRPGLGTHLKHSP